MNKFMSTLQKDVMVQSRNNLYAITILVALVFAVIFTFILQPKYLSNAIPATLLFVVGGTTIVFIGALLMEEKELGLINAFTVTPLSMKTYLASKIFSLTFLSTLEVGIMVGVPIYWNNSNYGTPLPNILLLFIAVASLNLFYTLLGMAIAVRFNKLTDVMMPIVVVMIFLQVPIIYFAGIIESKLLLIIPSAAPIMLVQGAFSSLEIWQWLYGVIYTMIIILIAGIWSHRAFDAHILKGTR